MMELALPKESKALSHRQKSKGVPVLKKSVKIFFCQPCGWIEVIRRIFMEVSGESLRPSINPQILISYFIKFFYLSSSPLQTFLGNYKYNCLSICL